MDYQSIGLPADGFQDYQGGPRLHDLEVCVGALDAFSTTLHVRGFVEHGAGVYPFAGSTVLREGRDHPDHDLRVLSRGDVSSQAVLDSLALSVHLALDQYAEGLIANEME